MVGSGTPVGSQPVNSLDKEQAEDGEEESGDFEPEDAAGVDERSPYGFAKPFCSFGCAFGARGVYGGVLLCGLRGLRGAVA